MRRFCSSLRARRGAARRLLGPGGVAVLLALHVVLAVSATRAKSTTFDGLAHLTAGVSYWRANDYRLHPENGLLPQRWAALPLALGAYAFPPPDPQAWAVSRNNRRLTRTCPRRRRRASRRPRRVPSLSLPAR